MVGPIKREGCCDIWSRRRGNNRDSDSVDIDMNVGRVGSIGIDHPTSNIDRAWSCLHHIKRPIRTSGWHSDGLTRQETWSTGPGVVYAVDTHLNWSAGRVNLSVETMIAGDAEEIVDIGP